MEYKQKFEKEVIDVILNLIKDNQVYLTQPENLPQLAKLGYMYNTLWYAGRVSYGYDGIIDKNDHSCEDNPKYKIEMCEPDTDIIEDYIYDAWGMHINDDHISYNRFMNTVRGDVKINDTLLKLSQKNLSFNNYVDIFLNKEYRYNGLYDNEKSVRNYLLCTIGTGYGLNDDGFIHRKASGADMDLADYGNWQKAVFSNNIQIVVDNLLKSPYIKLALDAQTKYFNEVKSERMRNNISMYNSILNIDEVTEKLKGTLSYDELKDVEKIINDKMESRLYEREPQTKKEKYSKYYPICEYSIISKLTKDSDDECIDAGILVCEEILKNNLEESQGNVEFAKSFLKKFKPTYKDWLQLRSDSENNSQEKLCYCGHTNKCECGDPDEETFKGSVKRGTIKPFDKNNGWLKIKDEK